MRSSPSSCDATRRSIKPRLPLDKQKGVQGSQLTSTAFTGLLMANGIAISMDGRGAWRDDVFVERIWRSVKYEKVYLHAYDSVGEARASLGKYLHFTTANARIRALTPVRRTGPIPIKPQRWPRPPEIFCRRRNGRDPT